MVKLTVLHTSTSDLILINILHMSLYGSIFSSSILINRAEDTFNTALDSVTPQFKLLNVHAILLNNFKRVPIWILFRIPRVKPHSYARYRMCQTSSSLVVRNPLSVSLPPIIACDHATFYTY